MGYTFQYEGERKGELERRVSERVGKTAGQEKKRGGEERTRKRLKERKELYLHMLKENLVEKKLQE